MICTLTRAMSFQLIANKGSDILIKMNKKIKVTLELDAIAVGKIEAAAEGDIQSLLEDEINNNPDAFIEMMGYDNW